MGRIEFKFVLFLFYPTPLYSTATYADDTVVLSSHEDKSTATYYLHKNLREIELWLKKMAD